jgi:hypothetical protein
LALEVKYLPHRSDFDMVTDRASSLYGTAYQFSKKFFTGWVIVSLLWAFFSFGSVTVYPIIEERHRLLSWIKDISGKPKATESGDDLVDEIKVKHNGKDIEI